jgi:hypothetical protein
MNLPGILTAKELLETHVLIKNQEISTCSNSSLPVKKFLTLTHQ